MSEEETGKSRGLGPGVSHPQHHPHQYGTFEGTPTYPQPVIGFPQPVPPPGSAPPPPPPPYHYAEGYQPVPVAEGTPVRVRRLPCCGLGMGWCLFIIGFFLVAIPWYVGAFIILCSRVDNREKPGFVACTVAAVLATLAIILGATKGTHAW